MKTSRLISTFFVTFLITMLTVFAQVAINPSSPSDNDNLVCGITGANPAAYIFVWSQDGTSKTEYTGNTVPFSATSPSQIWKCEMKPNIPGAAGNLVIGVATVKIPSIIPPNIAPIASFTSNSPVNEGTSVSFTDSSTDDGTIVSRLWNFSDGTTSTSQNPSHLFAGNGSYGVVLIVTDNNGVSNTTSGTVVVNDLIPNPSFVIPSSALVNQTLSFNGQATYIVDSIASWSWDFGDGNAASTQNSTHYYSLNGTYVVALSVTDSDGSVKNYNRTIVAHTPNIHGRIFDTNTSQPVAAANISFYDNSTCNLDEVSLVETGNCNFNPKPTPDAVTDINGLYHAYLPRGIYHMLIRHSVQVDRNIFMNDSDVNFDTELKENGNKNYNFEGHIIYGGRYRDGNKYVVGDNLTFVMFGVNHEAQPVTVSFMVENHTGTGNGANGPWVYNGSFTTETLTVPANGAKVNQMFSIIIPPEFSTPGRYDIHVLVNNSGTLEKWHKIGNFFIEEINATNPRLPPEVKLVQGPNFFDLTDGNLSVGQYLNQSFNVSFNVKIKPQPNTINGILFSAATLSDVPCIFAPGGDEVIIDAPNGFINVSDMTGNDQLKFNVTNARTSAGCYIDSNYRYSQSDRFAISISVKEQYYGAISPIKYVNASIWATEQMARDIYYDVTENSLVRPADKQVNFTGFYSGERNPGVGAGGYGAFNQFNVTRSHNTPSYYNLQTDLFDTTWGFEYRSTEDGFDFGSFTYPSGSPAPCQNEPEVNGIGATNCEKAALTARWQGVITPHYILVLDPMISVEVVNSILNFGDYMVSQGQNP